MQSAMEKRKDRNCPNPRGMAIPEELRSIHWCAPHASVSPAAGKLSAARERENRDRALAQRGQPTAVKLSTANTTGGRIAGENPRRRANH